MRVLWAGCYVCVYVGCVLGGMCVLWAGCLGVGVCDVHILWGLCLWWVGSLWDVGFFVAMSMRSACLEHVGAWGGRSGQAGRQAG